MMAGMIRLPWMHVAAARAQAELDREQTRCELEKAQAELEHAQRQRSWVESMVEPITKRHRKNHYGRDVTITYAPRGNGARPAESGS